MNLFLSHDSALEYWRSAGAAKPTRAEARRPKHASLARASEARFRPRSSFGARKPELVRTRALPNAVPTAEFIASCEPWRFGVREEPLHILVGQQRARSKSSRVVSHLMKAQAPSGSFCRVEEGLYVSSPELCFVQMATRLSLPELIMLGFELCGSYALDPLDARRFGRREPLATAESLARFAQRAEGIHGRKAAMRAARMVIDGSASPMETALAMLLSLPRMLGGFGIEKPCLNWRINLSDDARLTAGRSFLVCDLFWEKAKLDVEYDGRLYHSRPQHVESDAARRNALGAMGIAVITATAAQVHDPARLKSLAADVARRTGGRPFKSDDAWRRRHAELRARVLDTRPATTGPSVAARTRIRTAPRRR